MPIFLHYRHSCRLLTCRHLTKNTFSIYLLAKVRLDFCQFVKWTGTREYNWMKHPWRPISAHACWKAHRAALCAFQQKHVIFPLRAWIESKVRCSCVHISWKSGKGMYLSARFWGIRTSKSPSKIRAKFLNFF